ncbi:MAG: hypothetical protein V8S89_03140 [Oscillospiraceae bacterium]|nr:hypothetical protein [Oscillospiraceae bacterium]
MIDTEKILPRKRHPGDIGGFSSIISVFATFSIKNITRAAAPGEKAV